MAETVSTNQFRNGMHIEIDGAVWRIVEFQHVKPGKGGAFVRTKLKALEAGSVVDRTFRAGEKFARVHTEVKNLQFLYDDGTEAHFMDEETYEQFGLPHAEVADELAYLAAVELRADARRRRQAVGDPAPGIRRADSRPDRACGPRRHGHQRDEAGDARDGRGRAGAAVRGQGRAHQGRSARRPLHLASLISRGRDASLRSRAVPKLVDTTIRLLSQEPLAGRLPTAEVLRVAEILDQAGSRVSRCRAEGSSMRPCVAASRARGSGSARSRGVCRRRSGIALRGRFLVGSRPVCGDIVGRFVSCAAENGIDVFRLHDPLNDVSNLREAGAAITSAGGAFHAGLVYSPGRTGETETDRSSSRRGSCPSSARRGSS